MKSAPAAREEVRALGRIMRIQKVEDHSQIPQRDHWLHAGLSAASQAVWGVRGYFASPLFFFLPLLALGRSATDLRSGDRRGGAPSGPVFPTQNGKVAIVTGGAKGIGYHTVKHLARLGMHVIIAGNSEREGQEAVRKIKEETLTGKVEFLYCDLASMKSIRQFVQQFRAKNCPLHVLVNNAGVMLVPERQTEDGFEVHFGLNYLGHFLLTNLLLDTLKQSGTHSHSARIVTVSSATHYVGKLHLDDLQSRCSYSPHGAYAQSKLALVLFTYRLQHLLTANGSHVTANVVDPGVVNTELYKHVFWVVKVFKWMTAWLLFKTPEEGASTTIYAAVSPEIEGAGGCYLYNEERTKSADVAYDEELQRRLWTESCKMVRISDESSRAP